MSNLIRSGIRAKNWPIEATMLSTLSPKIKIPGNVTGPLQYYCIEVQNHSEIICLCSKLVGKGPLMK